MKNFGLHISEQQVLCLDSKLMEKDKFYDAYMLKISGIPLLAGYIGLDFCESDYKSHELIIELLAILYTFSQEIFKSTELQSINYKDVKVTMKFDKDIDLLMAFVVPSNAIEKRIRKKN